VHAIRGHLLRLRPRHQGSSKKLTLSHVTY